MQADPTGAGAAPRGPQAGEWVRGLGRNAAGELLGAVTAVIHLGYTLCAGVLLLVTLPWPAVSSTMSGFLGAGATRLTKLERARIRVFHRGTIADEYGGRRALTYLALRWPLGLLGGTILVLCFYGAVGAFNGFRHWLDEGSLGEVPNAAALVWLVVLGATLLFLALVGIDGVATLERRLAIRCLGPSAEQLLRRRVAELATSRAAVVEAVDDERRRIERDLHDGVQQRVVALGMLIGRARRGGSPERTDELLRQAQRESQALLDDLREVAWRVYPSALDDGGLRAALETVAERSAIPVQLRYGLTVRPPVPVETVAYFVVAEAVTNAAKHSGAASVRVSAAEVDDALVVRVSDDGRGGADPAGGGLSGLARRAAALDGKLTVDSPVGGPTVITVELPCG